MLVCALDTTCSTNSSGPFFCYTLTLGISFPTSLSPLTAVCPSWLRLSVVGGFCVCVCMWGGGGESHNQILLIIVSTQQPYPFLGCLFALVFVKYMDLKYIHFNKARNILKRTGVCDTRKSAVGTGLGNVLED